MKGLPAVITSVGFIGIATTLALGFLWAPSVSINARLRTPLHNEFFTGMFQVHGLQ